MPAATEAEELNQIRTNTILDDLTFDQAEKALALAGPEKDDIDLKEKFYGEDHLQEGKAYMGPRPINAEGQLIVEELQRNFVSKNAIGEIVDRENNTVIGHQPNWTVTVRRPLKKIPKQLPVRVEDAANPGVMIDDPTGATQDDPTGAMIDEPLKADEQSRVDEMNMMLVSWWDRHEALIALQTAGKKSALHGRGYLRLFVPQKKLGVGNKLVAKTVDEAAQMIFVESPEVTNARIVIDPLSMERVGYSRFMVGEDPVIEAVALTEDGKTIIKTIAKDQGKIQSTQSSPLPLDRRLTLIEVKGKKLVTRQIISQQKLLNLALTMCGHNLVEAGFRTETVTNAEFAEEEVSDLTAPGGKRKVPASLPRGPAATRNVMGFQYVDREGKTQVMTPGYHVSEPVPVDTFVKSKQLAYSCILEEAHQLHALLSGEGAPSGESRITALADHIVHALNRKTAIDTGGQALLETVAAMAAEFTGQAGRYDDLRVNFSSKIDPGRLTPSEREALMKEVEKKLKSRKTYMLITGEGDPEAELSQIFVESRQMQQLGPAPATIPKPPGGNEPPPGNNPPGNNPPPPAQ